MAVAEVVGETKRIFFFFNMEDVRMKIGRLTHTAKAL